jgi:hypothetical protein
MEIKSAMGTSGVSGALFEADAPRPLLNPPRVTLQEQDKASIAEADQS